MWCIWYRSMWSVCSRRSESSQARRMLTADSRLWLGQSPIEPNTLVASTTLSRRSPPLANQRPMICSVTPSPTRQPYTLAVSKKLMPSSRARSMMRWESVSEVSGPKFMVPRQIRLTRSPVRPRWAYCMGAPGWSGVAGRHPATCQGSDRSGEWLEDVRRALHDLRREHPGGQRAAGEFGEEAGDRNAVVLLTGGAGFQQDDRPAVRLPLGEPVELVAVVAAAERQHPARFWERGQRQPVREALPGLYVGCQDGFLLVEQVAVLTLGERVEQPEEVVELARAVQLGEGFVVGGQGGPEFGLDLGPAVRLAGLDRLGGRRDELPQALQAHGCLRGVRVTSRPATGRIRGPWPRRC